MFYYLHYTVMLFISLPQLSPFLSISSILEEKNPY